MQSPSYLTALRDKWLALLCMGAVGDRAKLLLFWLVFSANPRTGRVEPVTVAEIARELSWSRTTVTRALDDLAGAGMVDVHLPTGASRDGHIEVVAYYDVLTPTRWLSRQRAIGENTARRGAPPPDDAGCDELATAGLVDKAVALAVQNARERDQALRALHRGRPAARTA